MPFLLVHSPFLGPGVWRPLEALLAQRGHKVFAPDLRPGLRSVHGAYQDMADRAAVSAEGDAVVVLHSGAGALAPSIWNADKRLDRMVFVDALLPHPGVSWLGTLPPGMAEKLRETTRNGRLPPWPTWLPAGLFEQLVPDDDLRALISAEAPNVPVSYVSETAPHIPGWSSAVRGCYIKLSPAYDTEASKAAVIGFRIDEFAGNHLSLVSDPSSVGELLIGAAEES